MAIGTYDPRPPRPRAASTGGAHNPTLEEALCLAPFAAKKLREKGLVYVSDASNYAMVYVWRALREVQAHGLIELLADHLLAQRLTFANGESAEPLCQGGVADRDGKFLKGIRLSLGTRPLLVAEGLLCLELIAQVADAELLSISGIGPKNVADLRAASTRMAMSCE